MLFLFDQSYFCAFSKKIVMIVYATLLLDVAYAHVHVKVT